MTANIRLCEPAAKLEQDWRDVYAAAFPLAEQEPEAKLQQLIDAGRLLYHKTIGKQGELLCFSLVSLAPDFSFLAYIATDPKQRSGGYGSKHMRALIDLFKQQYPAHVGLFLEIESTNPRTLKLSEDDKNIRQRRLGFYRRLGARRLCRGMQYITPNRQGDGEQELDILFFNFCSDVLEHREKERIVSEIYQRFYGLGPTDRLVARALAGIAVCLHVKCEEEAADSSATDSLTATADSSATRQPPGSNGVVTPASGFSSATDSSKAGAGLKPTSADVALPAALPTKLPAKAQQFAKPLGFKNAAKEGAARLRKANGLIS